jgi:drug/metabolite transporter (DMT)-like permease
MNPRRTFAIACLVTVMIIWGSTFVVTKAAARDIPPLTLAALRFLIAAIVLIPLALHRGGIRRLPQPIAWRALILMALTGIAAFAIAFNYALVYGSAAQGALIYALVPAAVALAAVGFLKERLSKQRVFGIVLSIIGVVLVASGGESSLAAPRPLLGALWMLAAVVVWTAYTVLAKQLAHADHIVTIAVISLLGAAMLVPAAAIELAAAPTFSPSIGAWGGALFLGVAASALAYIAYGYALRELDASVVGVYTNLDPIVGVVTAVLFLGETLYTGQIFGGLVAFFGMWLASRESEGMKNDEVVK